VGGRGVSKRGEFEILCYTTLYPMLGLRGKWVKNDCISNWGSLLQFLLCIYRDASFLQPGTQCLSHVGVDCTISTHLVLYQYQHPFT
jgi:hypothetical protein